MSRLFWSVQARADLRRIDKWLSVNASREIATHILAAIGERSTLLLEFPLAAPVGEENERSLRVTGTPYILLYRPRKAGIEILRIHHIRQDWKPQ